MFLNNIKNQPMHQEVKISIQKDMLTSMIQKKKDKWQMFLINIKKATNASRDQNVGFIHLIQKDMLTSTTTLSNTRTTMSVCPSLICLPNYHFRYYGS